MTNQHLITPPIQLVQEWATDKDYDERDWLYERHIATQAARWGSDQELEACCEWFVCDWTDIETADRLRAARRPKPPSLKEQAQVELDRLVALISTKGALAMAEPIRRALETLDD